MCFVSGSNYTCKYKYVICLRVCYITLSLYKMNSVYELLQWHDPRLAYDLDDEAKCIFGSGRSFSPTFDIFEFEYDGDEQRIWKPTIFMLTQRGGVEITNSYTNVDQFGYVTHVSLNIYIIYMFKNGSFGYILMYY